MHTWARRRTVQVLHLGQEFLPNVSWHRLVIRMRARARVAGEQRVAISDTNIVIQSPSTVIDSPTDTRPPDNDRLTLWDIEMPARTDDQPVDGTRDSQYAAAAAIAVLARGADNSNVSALSDDIEEMLRPLTDVGMTRDNMISIGMPTIVNSGQDVILGEDSSSNANQETTSAPSTALPTSVPTTSSSSLSSRDAIITVSPLPEDMPSSSSSSEPGPSTLSPPSVPEVTATTSERVAGGSDTACPCVRSASSTLRNEPLISVAKETTEPPEVATEKANATLRLKFLDDTQTDAVVSLNETVAAFKRKNFAQAAADGKVVRLIFQGQLLRDDTRTLESYGLKDGCVVHCHVSLTPYQTTDRNTNSEQQAGEIRRRRPTEGAAEAVNAIPDMEDLMNPARFDGQGSNRGRVFFAPRRHNILFIICIYVLNFVMNLVPSPAALRAWVMHMRRPARRTPTTTQQQQQHPHPAGRPNVFWRAYQWLHNSILNWDGEADEDDGVGPRNLDEAAEAASRPMMPQINLGDYVLYIFACQFVAVWLFVYYFPQVCDKTALSLLVLLTLYFVFVVCRNSPGNPLTRQNSNVGDQQNGPAHVHAENLNFL